jgi:hypothetical protein
MLLLMFYVNVKFLLCKAVHRTTIRLKLYAPLVPFTLTIEISVIELTCFYLEDFQSSMTELKTN